MTLSSSHRFTKRIVSSVIPAPGQVSNSVSALGRTSIQPGEARDASKGARNWPDTIPKSSIISSNPKYEISNKAEPAYAQALRSRVQVKNLPSYHDATLTLGCMAKVAHVTLSSILQMHQPLFLSCFISAGAWMVTMRFLMAAHSTIALQEKIHPFSV